VQVDEARTPLIIAKQVAAPAERYELAQQMARVLVKDEHYQVDIKGNQVGRKRKLIFSRYLCFAYVKGRETKVFD